MFYALRRLERWLHQHIFKVGWLATKKLQTTTILYYAFFLPGIFLHELTYWLVAGLLNVRAERALEWPKAQDIGELKLNFVKLSPKTSPIKLAVITLSPFVAGVLAVWLIANNLLNVSAFAAAMQAGLLADLPAAVGQLTSATDFWLWFYLIFTISNTLMPSRPEHLRGWRVVLVALGIAFAVLVVLGTADEVLSNALIALNNSINSLSGLLAVIIGVDVFMVAVLGTIEAVVERITGDSATFENGKMVTMRRSEMLQRRSEAFSQARARPAHPKASRAAPAGPPSVYRLALPIPGPPGKEAVSRDEGRIIAPEQKPLLAPVPGRTGPEMIAGSVEKSSAGENARPAPQGLDVKRLEAEPDDFDYEEDDADESV